jgi:hypothetical protein
MARTSLRRDSVSAYVSCPRCGESRDPLSERSVSQPENDGEARSEHRYARENDDRRGLSRHCEEHQQHQRERGHPTLEESFSTQPGSALPSTLNPSHKREHMPGLDRRTILESTLEGDETVAADAT